MGKKIRLIIHGITATFLTGIGIKLTTILGTWQYIPFFPNILDTSIMITSGICVYYFLLADLWKLLHKRSETK